MELTKTRNNCMSLQSLQEVPIIALYNHLHNGYFKLMKSAAYKNILNGILLAGIISAGCLMPVAAAETLNVAVASNFLSTLQRIQPEFEQASGHKLNLISGSSGRHYAQIINGAPFDLFLSADTERTEALERNGFINNAQRRIYALGRLALWSRDERLGADLQVLSQLTDGQRLAMANPRLAPYGRAAVESLQYLGLHERVRDQLAMGENVGQAFQFVYSGSAIVGFVAYAQVLSSPVPGSYSLLPDEAYQPIAQEMALLQPTAAARALFDFLGSDAMIPILEQAGYYGPQGRAGGN